MSKNSGQGSLAAYPFCSIYEVLTGMIANGKMGMSIFSGLT
jgi:hypothetical protein